MRSIFQHAKNRNVIAIQRDVLVLIAIKSTAMLLLLQIDPYPSILEWISGYTRKEAYAKALGVSFISILCIAAIAACGFMRNAWLRVIIVCTIASLYWMNLTYHRIVGEPIDYLAASILLGETREIGRALSMYHREALAVLAIVIPPAVALAYLPRRCPLKLPAWTASLSLLAMALVFAVLCVTGGVSRFPTPFTLPGHLGLVALLRPYSGPREPVTYSGEIAPMVRHVVFIVDESVRGDLLGINDPRHPTTPYLATNGQHLINFGIASALSNCSVSTRLALRAGLRRDQIPDRRYESLRQPSLWQFAKHAGFKTLYIDAPGGYHSYMNGYEAAYIDQRYHLSDVPKPQIDMQMADLIKRLLAHDDHVFIFAEKLGVHFPYSSNYPSSLTAGNHNYSNRIGMVADYSNGIRWSVDGFFERLMSGLDLSDTLIIYTSDHGQNLMDDGLLATHCRTQKPTAAEARVPLLALTAHPELERSLAHAARKSPDEFSHFAIVPTLLYAMGYDREWVRREKGGDLLQPGGSDQSFYVGGIFGQSRAGRWIPFSARDRP